MHVCALWLIWNSLCVQHPLKIHHSCLCVLIIALLTSVVLSAGRLLLTAEYV